jgi:hypothetical protein
MVRARGIEELGTQQRGGRFLFWNGDVRGMSPTDLRTHRRDPYRTRVSTQVFTGAVPFSEKPGTAAMFAIVNGGRPPRPEQPVIAERLWSLMERCWDSEPHLRPEVSQALEILLNVSVSSLFIDCQLFTLTVDSCTAISWRMTNQPHKPLPQRIGLPKPWRSRRMFPSQRGSLRLHRAPPPCKSSMTSARLYPTFRTNFSMHSTGRSM